MPADFRRSDEAQEGNARVRCKRLRERIVVENHGLAPGFWQPCSVCQLDEVQTGERSNGSRLDEHWTTSGDRRNDLMHDEIERMIEGRNGNHRSDRLLRRKGPAIAR